MALTAIPGLTLCLEGIVAFNAALFGADFPTARTQQNRVAEMSAPNFAMMTPVDRGRLSTNVDTYDDCQFVASIAGAQMTVTSVAFGKVTAGRRVYGVGVSDGTTIVSGPADGGPGVYVVSPEQTVASRVMAAGVENIATPTRYDVQVDFYGAESADKATVFAQVFRDEYGCTIFAGLPGGLSPLYTSDPRQVQFVAEEQQYQGRWTLTVSMQADSVVTVPKEFADRIEIDRIAVDAFYAA